MAILNDKFIKPLPIPKSKHKIYWDDKVIGLGLRITNKNFKSFVLRYVIDGRERKYTIGSYPELSCTAAREIAGRLKGEIIKGNDPLEDRKAAYGTPTLKEFWLEFLKSKEKILRTKTLDNYKIVMKTHILPKFGNYKINSIIKRDIENFHSCLSSTPVVANKSLQILSSIFSTAINWGLVSNNQVTGIKKFKEHKRERYLSEEEIAKLIEALDMAQNQMNTNAVKLILLTGSRKTEVLSARWQDFDFEKAVWNKPSFLTKQNKSSHVPLNSEALEILLNMKQNIVADQDIENYPEDQIISTKEYVFYNPKIKTHLKDIKRFWANICKKAGIENARIHDLRHTFASILVSNGVSLEVIGKLIGHSNITTTQRYSHLANEALKQASEAFVSKIKKAS